MKKPLLLARLTIVRLFFVASLVLAAPGQPQQQAPLINPDASAVNEETLLRQSPRIEGEFTFSTRRGRTDPTGRARMALFPRSDFALVRVDDDP